MYEDRAVVEFWDFVLEQYRHGIAHYTVNEDTTVTITSYQVGIINYEYTFTADAGEVDAGVKSADHVKGAVKVLATDPEIKTDPTIITTDEPTVEPEPAADPEPEQTEPETKAFDFEQIDVKSWFK